MAGEIEIFVMFTLLFGIIASLGIVMIFFFFFRREIDFLPRIYYAVEVYHKKTPESQPELAWTSKAWEVKRDKVTNLRIATGPLITGVELDAGYSASIETNNNGKPVLRLLEKIPGQRSPSNFEPLKLKFNLKEDLEREIRKDTVSLAEVIQRLAVTDIQTVSPETVAKLKESALAITNDLNARLDEVLDHDSQLQQVSVSPWQSLVANTAEREEYRTSKKDWLQEYLPMLGVVFIGLILLVLAIVGLDYEQKAMAQSVGPVATSCNHAAEMFTIQAQACGWVRDKTTNTTIPVGVNIG